MTPEQHEQMMIALNEHTRTLHRIRESLDLGLGAIRDGITGIGGQMPKPIVPTVPTAPYFADPVFVPMRGQTRNEQPARPAESPAATAANAAVGLGQRRVLQVFLEVLDEWIEATRENCAAMEHRDEPVGSGCGQVLRPSEVRDLVNEVSRSFKIGIFPTPLPLEDGS